MATVAKSITLDEAVQKAKSMDNKGYLWVVNENIFNLEIPHGCRFNCIGVTWFSFAEGYTAAETLISNYPDRTAVLRPYEAYMLYHK